MARAYGWAFLKPIRKVFYNLTVTVLSVVVALAIGGLVLVGLLVEKLGIDTGPLALLGGLDLESVGFVIVGLFVLTWLVALATWKFGRIEERVGSARSPASPATVGDRPAVARAPRPPNRARCPRPPVTGRHPNA